MKLLNVARWEFLKTARSRSFLVMVFLIPLLMGAFGGIPLLIEHLSSHSARVIAVIDETGEIYGALKEGLEGSPYRLERAEGPPSALTEQLKEGEIDGYLLIGTDIYETDQATFYARDIGDLDVGAIEDVLSSIVIEHRLQEAGYASEMVRQLIREVRVIPRPVGAEGMSLSTLIVPLGLAFLLVMGAMFSGGMLMQSVIKEKGNRVVELLLSSISTQELLAGKILGYAGVSLLQIAIWGGVALVVAGRYLDISLASLPPVKLVLYLLYFILGYLLIAAIYAALGAGMKEAQSGSQFQGFAAILPVVPVMLSGSIIPHPDLLWVRIMGFIPPFTPATMMLRMAVGRVAWWEVLASLAILALFVYLLMRFAAKVFEVGMLMYGKSATIKELWRWGTQGFRRSRTSVNW